MPRRTEIITIDPRVIKLLPINARFMRYEMFQRLVENVKRDGQLESVPLLAILGLYADGDEPLRDEATGDPIYEVLSGNHRVKAAIAAGLTEIRALAILDPVPREERIAKQLSHNSIEGEDDPAILKQLYTELDLDLKQYAGLDDKTLELMGEVKIGTLAEANLTYQSVSLVFLPEEAAAVDAAFRAAKALAPGDLYLARFGEYDRLLDRLEDIGSAHMVKSAASQLLLMLELVERHLDELRTGWYNELTGQARHDKTAPLTSLFETTAIPTKHAVIIARALKEARARQVAPAEAMARWAQTYLDGLKQ